MPIRNHMGPVTLVVNPLPTIGNSLKKQKSLYRLFCFFKLFPMVGKGLDSLVTESAITSAVNFNIYMLKINAISFGCVQIILLETSSCVHSI